MECIHHTTTYEYMITKQSIFSTFLNVLGVQYCITNYSKYDRIGWIIVLV